MNVGAVNVADFFSSFTAHLMSPPHGIGYGKRSREEILNEAKKILEEAGVNLNGPVSKRDFGKVIFQATRKVENIKGTPNPICEIRDFTHNVVGDEIFAENYKGMRTVNNVSWFDEA